MTACSILQTTRVIKGLAITDSVMARLLSEIRLPIDPVGPTLRAIVRNRKLWKCATHAALEAVQQYHSIHLNPLGFVENVVVAVGQR